MPVPQENSFFVERASCPFLTMVQDISIAIMMEHPLPGKGGCHRQTISYGQSPNLSLLPREALAREISDARAIYRRQGLYTPQIRRSLQQVIQSNKLAWLGVFEKGVNS